MKPEEALSRAAAATTRYRVWTPGGGVVTFDSSDVGHALAGVDDAACKLLLCKFASGGERDKQDLRRYLLGELVRDQAPWQWRIAYEMIARSAVAEVLVDQLCRTCGGRGAVQPVEGGALQECPDCGGFGSRPRSQMERARAIGLPETTYRRRVESEYKQALRVLLGWMHEGLDKMRENLR